MNNTAHITRFEKWEGLGNDFIVLGPDADVTVSPEIARNLCDRRRGIGADGVLVVNRLPDGRSKMIVYNADGSRPEMCGNGLRCVAAFLYDKEGPTDTDGSRVISTDAGDRTCIVRQNVREGRYDVDVDMGEARLGPELVTAIDDTTHAFLTVDVGNPHAITFDPHTDETIDRIAPRVATSIPSGTNVEFCRVERGPDGAHIAVVVWERGVGRTLACGTGACAVAAAACATGRARYGSPILISLPGGDLEITVGEDRRNLRMRGPAQKVFKGELVIL